MDHLIDHNTLKIFSSTADLFTNAAKDFFQRAAAAIAEKNAFNVVLSGGSTAKFFFDALIKIQESHHEIHWPQIKFYFGDERYVPADNPDSNYFSAQQHLFSKLPISPENIVRIPTEFSDPHEAAQEYAEKIRQINFDLVYLGLGDDAHTASLMPFSEALDAEGLVAALWVEHLKMYRITLTYQAINRSTAISFLVTGANKADAVAQTLEGPLNPKKYPAQLIQAADENNIWWLDRPAAKQVTLSKG